MIPILPFLNNAKDLDPSYKTDLELLDCFERKKLCLITEEIRYLRLYIYNINSLQWKNDMPSKTSFPWTLYKHFSKRFLSLLYSEQNITKYKKSLQKFIIRLDMSPYKTALLSAPCPLYKFNIKTLTFP